MLLPNISGVSYTCGLLQMAHQIISRNRCELISFSGLIFIDDVALRRDRLMMYMLYTLTALFIDVGTNYSVLDHTNLSFIYEDVLYPGPNSDGEFVGVILCSFQSGLFVTNNKSVLKR